jgi:hypothetical protein
MSRTQTAPKVYPPGYFTALMRRHNWPPNFQSALQLDDKRYGVVASQRASQQREAGVANGQLWAIGTVPELKHKGYEKPAWMGKA